MLDLFKTIIHFTLVKFEELLQLLILTIIKHVRSTDEMHHIFGRLFKLFSKQNWLSFILYMNHNNITKHDVFLWNWFKSAINDNDIFIACCINSIIVDDI
jgi:hypothetical protein